MSDAQKRVPHGRRRLRRIDRELRRSDPELASMLSIFSRLNAGEMMPGWEQVRTSPALDWRPGCRLRPGYRQAVALAAPSRRV